MGSTIKLPSLQPRKMDCEVLITQRTSLSTTSAFDQVTFTQQTTMIEKLWTMASSFYACDDPSDFFVVETATVLPVINQCAIKYRIYTTLESGVGFCEHVQNDSFGAHITYYMYFT